MLKALDVRTVNSNCQLIPQKFFKILFDTKKKLEDESLSAKHSCFFFFFSHKTTAFSDYLKTVKKCFFSLKNLNKLFGISTKFA